MNEASRKKLDELAKAMTAFYRGDPARVQHFMKVNAYSALIARLEGMDGKNQFILEAAAYTHDIGIRPAEEKYGSSNGRLQEKLGPPAARELLNRLGFEDEVIKRVCDMISRHHTYTGIDSPELQILIEADFIVNLFEENADENTVDTAIIKIFRTGSGTALAKTIFDRE